MARNTKQRLNQAQSQILRQLAEAGKRCREVEEALARDPAPELETLIKVHRVLILKLSSEAGANPELLKLVGILMKPVLEWARLEEKRKERELAARQQQDAQSGAKALRPETLEQIELELKLL